MSDKTLRPPRRWRRKMPNDLIDISLSVTARSVVWPGAPRPEIVRRLSMDRGDSVNDSNLFMNVHTGTHIDAPLHHLPDGSGTDGVGLDLMVGEVAVLDLTGAEAIDVSELERVWPDSPGPTRILLKTRNSTYWADGTDGFVRDYVALTPDTSDWLIDRGVVLVGIDYLSVQRFDDPPDIHKTLLGAGVVLLEGLDLGAVAAGRYELLCLPLKLADSDGAPARAILRRLS